MARGTRKRTYGTGSVSPIGRRWKVRWRENGERYSRTFMTREIAEGALHIIKGNIARGLAGRPEHAVEQAELVATTGDRRAMGAAFDDAHLYAEAKLGAVALAEYDTEDICDVYMVTDLARDVVKIGQTARELAQVRLARLQTGNASRLEILVAVPGRRGLSEKVLHEAFAHARVSGEWFLYTNRIRQFADFMRFAWGRERSIGAAEARLPNG